jgi:hypothetical protein
MTRWTFVHELLELNADVQTAAQFDAALPQDTSEPNDQFLAKYSAAAWTLVKPWDQTLAGYKL